MKKLLVVLCLATSITGLYAGNLLKNPSFEEQGSAPDLAANWNRWGDWINRETAWQPTHSGNCLIGYHHWQITSEKNSGIWQDIPNVRAGQKFKFSVFVSADQPNPGENPTSKIELRLEATRNGQQVTIQSKTYALADMPKDTGWHQLSVTGQTPEANLRVLICVTPAANGPRCAAIKFDDALLESE